MLHRHNVFSGSTAIAVGDEPTDMVAITSGGAVPLIIDTVLFPLFATYVIPEMESTANAVGDLPKLYCPCFHWKFL